MNTLFDLLANSAAKYPSKPVLIDGDDALSYGELFIRSRAFGFQLKARGFTKGHRCGLLLDNSAEYLIAYFGVLLAGGVVVPLCADTKAYVLKMYLTEADCQCLVFGKKNRNNVASVLAENDEAMISIGVDCEPLSSAHSHSWEEMVEGDVEKDSFPSCSAGDLAAIMFTSGTTAAPKGVMLSHGNLRANCEGIVDYLSLSETEVCGLTLPFYYSYGNSILLTHIAVGGTVVLAGNMMFPAKVLEVLAHHRCTGFPGVPSTFTSLVSFRDLSRFDLSALRYFTQAGGAMTPAMVTRIQSFFPDVSLFLMYGQTEASPRLTYLDPREVAKRPNSIGKPLAGVTLRIVDKDGNDVTPGEEGELLAKGGNVMAGYFRRDEESKATLKNGWLHTGDIARQDSEGFYFLVGREAEFIKSGAHRVSPYEIEAVIEMMDEVSQCGVCGVKNESLDEEIHAFVVLKEGNNLEAKVVQRFCLNALPRFKVPKAVHFLEKLPISERGKILRKRLQVLVI